MRLVASVVLALGLTGGLLLAPSAARAEAGMDTLRWLKQEPLTLLDWGMIQYRQDLLAAAQAIGAQHPLANGFIAGTYFDWRQDRVQGYVAFFLAPPERSVESCRTLFGAVVEELLSDSPRGAGRASWYLDNLFRHPGQRGARRPADLGDKILPRVELEVILRAPAHALDGGDTASARCRGRLDSKPGELEADATG